MKHLFTAIAVLLGTALLAQKKFNLQIGGGFGGVVEGNNKTPECDRKRTLRLGLGAALYYEAGPAFAAGIHVFTAENLLRVAGCPEYIPATNTEIMDNRSLSATAFLIRNRYYFIQNRKNKFYADAGLGIVNYYALVTAEKGTSVKTSFALSPEIGFETSQRFSIALFGIFGGNTPAYSGFDSFSNQNREIRANRSQQLFLKIAYKAFKF